MSIAAGTRLGSYEVVAQIGAGGMGEVYRAHDTKLARDVAIKVLPANVVNDPERLSRFQREARMLAALNHPNIATIYGLEQFDGVVCLVMELVPGETLAERVKAGPLPLEEALKIAVQIAEALEAAHEKSLIHRDLKPANVKVTPEGKVKVLDFGLAKAFEGDSATEDMSNSPTLSRAATMQGVILGTAAYMSPEQARGKACDRRTDIWAFGCVLYELLTARQAFQGETPTEILAAVLRGEPDWQALPETTPLSIRTLLRRCLQKETSKRARDAGDVRIEIEESLAAPVTAEADKAAKGVPWLERRALIPSVGALLIGAAIAAFAVWNLKPSPSPQPVIRTVINLPPGQQLAGLDSGPAIGLSPDGSHLVYVARQGGLQQLYLRAMDSLESKAIPGTEGAVNPFFSPDGQWLGFFAGGKLMKVSANGGAAIALGEASLPVGASWGNQGTIAFAPSSVATIQQVPDAGGGARVLTHIEKGENSNRWPEFLPGSRALLFTAGTAAANWINSRVAVRSAGTGEQRILIPGATHPHYALSGHLVYAQGVSLVAVPFDPQRLAVTGTAVPVVEGVLQSPVTGAAQYSFSATGSLVYVSGSVQSAQSRLVWVHRDGTEQTLDAPAHSYFNPRVSPNGREVAVTVTDKEAQIWLYDLLRETLTRLTFVGNVNNSPVWTPDGKRIAFNSNSSAKGALNIFWQLADGSGGIEQLTTSEFIQAPVSFSRDGQLLCFLEINPATGFDIWVLQVRDHKAQPFLRTPFNESAPQLSPDGRWLAYISTESGRYEIYVQPYPGPGGKWQISTEGGTEPVWNPNGRELFYRSGNKVMAVEISTQPSFVAGKPRMLFEGPYLPTPLTNPNYDVSPDGQRFLMLKPSESAEAAPTQINVVQNWFEELKQRVPAGTK
jgi:serine/threonine protein kinase/Tol biopolymer transport system component